MPQYDWLCDVCGCVMSPTSNIYWVELGFISNCKELQLRLVFLRYSADVASAFSWVVTPMKKLRDKNSTRSMRPIWVYLLWWEKIKKQVWILLKIEFGASCKDGKEKLLSEAGKEVLLKAVVQAIPMFAMSCFKLPVGLCQDIEMFIRNFWWEQMRERRKIHWIKWESMCKLKNVHGLGFRDLCKFNKAMLAK